MDYSVYILFSESCQKFYTGHSQDLNNRIVEHNSGETKSIKSCIPWTLIWQSVVSTRAEAMTIEKKIKSRGAKRFLADLNIDF